MQSPTDHNESTQEAQDEVSELNAVQSDALDASEEQDDSESTIARELAENSSSEVVEAPKVSFDTFDLQKPLREAIDTLGFEFCTPIQAQSLVHTLQGHDVTGKAQTGTGKTAAFFCNPDLSIAIFEALTAIVDVVSSVLGSIQRRSFIPVLS